MIRAPARARHIRSERAGRLQAGATEPMLL